MTQLLVWSALCEVKRSQEHCTMLENLEVNQGQRLWLAYLATRRDTYSIPAANCYGYAKNKREEARNVDPNRDFPYSRKNDKCMVTATAKLFNAIMSTSLTQLVVTFHGGMVAIGYEWGSLNHPNPNDGSPDDHANAQIAQNMKDFAGTCKGDKNMYPVGRINTVRGWEGDWVGRDWVGGDWVE
jgi:hypothetical protein